MKITPRGLAFDLLFGSNAKNDKHAVIDSIYDGFEEEISKWKTSNSEMTDYAEKLESALEDCGVDIDEIIGDK